MSAIDLLAILQKSLDRALFLYISMSKVRSSGFEHRFQIFQKMGVKFDDLFLN